MNKAPVQKPIVNAIPLSYVMPRAMAEELLNDKKVSYIDPVTQIRKTFTKPGLRTKKNLIKYINETFGLFGTVVEVQFS